MGREPDANIWLDSPRGASRHARLLVNGNCVTLEDLGSTNGSFVRDVRILAPARVEPGDVNSVGPFRLVFRVDAHPQSTQSELR